MTNREWLNTLSDEEFVKEALPFSCQNCPVTDICYKTTTPATCIDILTAWLRSEHKEGLTK